MNYSQIRKYDVTNGPGIRTTLFVSGCTHNCKECFNKDQQDFNYGNEWTREVEDDFISKASNKQIVGISLLGGEPFQQDTNIMINFLKRLKEEVNKEIWVWSGYTYDEIINHKEKSKMLNFIDVLVDGRFELDKRDLKLKFRGSSNQRIINVQESLKQNTVIELTIE